jgi:hypothetical protein
MAMERWQEDPRAVAPILELPVRLLLLYIKCRRPLREFDENFRREWNKTWLRSRDENARRSSQGAENARSYPMRGGMRGERRKRWLCVNRD